MGRHCEFGPQGVGTQGSRIRCICLITGEAI